MSLPGLRTDEMRRLYYDKRIKYPGSEEIKGLISLDEFILHYIAEIEEVISLKENEMTLNELLLRHTINDYHDMVLPLLLEIVDQYEVESQHNVSALLFLEKGILITALFILLLEALFIFRPIVKNIEERTRMLMQANKHLELKRHHDKMAALGQLSGGIAHEINNSLQPVLGLSGIIKMRTKGNDEELHHFATILENSALHARKIVNNVLSFSRQDKDVLEACCAKEVFEEACEFSNSFLPTSIKVKKYCNLKSSDTISCDKTSIIQVFVNIIKNSCDAMQDKGSLTINAYSHLVNTEDIPEGEYICVDIVDEGCGMSEEVSDSIFNPFFTTKGEGEGTGLGLSTAFGIMKRHEGHITVSSTIGEGSKFTLYFPKLSKSELEGLDSDRKRG